MRSTRVVCRAYCTCCIWIIQHARPSILTNIRAGRNMYRLLRIHVQENRCSKQSLEILRILLNMYNLFSLPLSLSLSISTVITHPYHSKSSGNQNEYTTSHSRWSSWLCSKVWKVLSWSESHPFSLFSPTARPKMPRQSRNLRLADVWPVSTIFGKCVLVIVSNLN